MLRSAGGAVVRILVQRWVVAVADHATPEVVWAEVLDDEGDWAGVATVAIEEDGSDEAGGGLVAAVLQDLEGAGLCPADELAVLKELVQGGFGLAPVLGASAGVVPVGARGELGLGLAAGLADGDAAAVVIAGDDPEPEEGVE